MITVTLHCLPLNYLLRNCPSSTFQTMPQKMLMVHLWVVYKVNMQTTHRLNSLSWIKYVVPSPQPSYTTFTLIQKLLNDSVPERPLIDNVTPMSELREEYEKGAHSFTRQIDWLISNGFNSIRRTRGAVHSWNVLKTNVYPLSCRRRRLLL